MNEGRKYNLDDLVDIRDVKVNKELPREERILDFLRQIKNPYLCKCGDVVVESVFADNGVTITERLEQYLRMS